MTSLSVISYYFITGPYLPVYDRTTVHQCVCYGWLQTPSGEVLNDSDDFTEGSYVLLLPNPVRGGNYSCEIPQLFHREACVSAGQHVKVKDTITVDEVGTDDADDHFETDENGDMYNYDENGDV